MKRLCIFSIVVVLFSSVRAQNELIINVLDKSNCPFELSIYKETKIRYTEFFKRQKVGDIEKTTDSTYILRINNIVEPQISNGLGIIGGKQLLVVAPGDRLNVTLQPPYGKWSLYEVIFHGRNAENL